MEIEVNQNKCKQVSQLRFGARTPIPIKSHTVVDQISASQARPGQVQCSPRIHT